MKLLKKTSVGGQWAKAGVDIKDQDIIKIIDSGTTIEGQYGPQLVFKVLTKNGEFVRPFNQTSINNLVDAYGEESMGWINKPAKAWVIKALVSGKMANVLYFAEPSWVMNDEGQFVKGEPTIGEDGTYSSTPF